MADLLALANWQRTKQRRSDRPKPITRPGSAKATKHGDASRLSPAAARALLESLKPKRG